MLPHFIPIDHYRKKLYSKEKNFKNFLNITDEQLEDIENKVKKRSEIFDEEQTSYIARKADKLDRYQRMLQYLTNPMIHLEFKTFDEIIAFMIKMADPNLVIYREYLRSNIMSLANISKVEDENERLRFVREREKALSDYEASVREQIGFFDPKLLKYEEIFFIFLISFGCTIILQPLF